MAKFRYVVEVEIPDGNIAQYARECDADLEEYTDALKYDTEESIYVQLEEAYGQGMVSVDAIEYDTENEVAESID